MSLGSGSRHPKELHSDARHLCCGLGEEGGSCNDHLLPFSELTRTVFTFSSPRNLRIACPAVPFHGNQRVSQECPRPIEENGKPYPLPDEEMSEMVSVVFCFVSTTGEVDIIESQSQMIKHTI